MKSYTLLCFFLSVAMILCPLCSVQKATDAISDKIFTSDAVEENEKGDSEIANSVVKVMSADSKNITETTLKEYLIGAAAAETGAVCHEEALKAQIVASHTLLEYTKLHKSESLGEADISDSGSSHQAYLDKEALKEKWGDKYDEYYEKTEKCVDEVIDLIMYFDGEPIAAAFHAISNGKTENAADVWGGKYPYLVSVSSEADKLSPGYSSTVFISDEDFKSITEKQGAKPESEPESWVKDTEKTSTGMVKSVTIGSKKFKGTEIRSLFSLKSSTFEISHADGGFTFSVKGYGHGVGMSQYGADYMAKQGFDFKKILSHYYSGVEIKQPQ